MAMSSDKGILSGLIDWVLAAFGGALGGGIVNLFANREFRAKVEEIDNKITYLLKSVRNNGRELENIRKELQKLMERVDQLEESVNILGEKRESP